MTRLVQASSCNKKARLSAGPFIARYPSGTISRSASGVFPCRRPNRRWAAVRRPRRRPEPAVIKSRSRAQRGAPFRPLLSARQLRKADGECKRALCKAGDRRCKIFDTPFVGSADRNRTRFQKTGPQSSCVWCNGSGCIFRNSIPCIFDGSCLASHSCRAKRYLGESRYFEGLFGTELLTRKRSFYVFGGYKCAFN